MAYVGYMPTYAILPTFFGSHYSLPLRDNYEFCRKSTSYSKKKQSFCLSNF